MEKKFVEKKLQEIENLNIDFSGQTILEKIDEGVHYFANPLRNEDEDNLEAIKALNNKLDRLKNERRRLVTVKRNMMNRNKKKLEEIRDLRRQIDDLE